MRSRRAGRGSARPLNCGVMRHVRLIAALSIGAMLSACASPNPYASTAAALSGVEYSGVNNGFSKLWKPTGRNAAYTLSEEESQRGGNDLTVCVDDLSQKFDAPQGRAPGRELRTVQLIDCMASKGWHMVVEELVVTQ
jgi:hypothetical protein